MAQPTEVGGNPVAEAEGLGGGVAGVVNQHHKSQVGPGGVRGEVGDDIPGRGHSWINNILLHKELVSQNQRVEHTYLWSAGNVARELLQSLQKGQVSDK